MSNLPTVLSQDEMYNVLCALSTLIERSGGEITFREDEIFNDKYIALEWTRDAEAGTITFTSRPAENPFQDFIDKVNNNDGP